jgi:glycine hydroxymethyltransferase
VDPQVADILHRELVRQNNTLQLIPSQSTVDEAILIAQGSIFTNLAIEGYPGRRYFPGAELVDQVEQLAIERAKELFGAEHANVQPHSGVNANMAVYSAVLEGGDTVLSMSLKQGGHLSHGYELSLTGRIYRFVNYSVDRSTEQIDYVALCELAQRERPKMIVAGGSAYPRIIDFARLREICDQVNAKLMVDMAHFGGLVAGRVHPSPIPYADFVSGTAYKTLGGSKGGYILCRREFAKQIDRSVFPGLQGSFGPQFLAGKAVTFKLALSEGFHEIQKRTVDNARRLARHFQQAGWRLVAGGTDTHLLVVDVGSRGLTGQQAEKALSAVGIYVNRNLIPFDERPPLVASGIRIGTPAITNRGFAESQIDSVAEIMLSVLEDSENERLRDEARHKVRVLCQQFPIYGFQFGPERED